MSIIDILKLPEAKSIKDLDSSKAAVVHKEIIQKKSFLRKIYCDFYDDFKKTAGSVSKGILVEIGSGGGFLKEIIPEVVTTDISPLPGIDVICTGTLLPFSDKSVRAFFLLNVLHHIKDPTSFLHEASRCLIPGGKIVMIEPYIGLWSSFIYNSFQHESFDTKADWKIEGEGRLTDANIALPWIIFYRDNKRFIKEFPELKINKLKPHTVFIYIISGGLSMRQLLPSFTYHLVKLFEVILSPFNKYLGMFMTIELEKIAKD